MRPSHSRWPTTVPGRVLAAEPLTVLRWIDGAACGEFMAG
jgi:hypothetical protein